MATRGKKDEIAPFETTTFDMARLMTEHAPRLTHPYKRLLYEIACPPGTGFSGEIRYTRWPPLSFPERVDALAAERILVEYDGIYHYEPIAGEPAAVEWHVNFADPHLFVAYDSGLFAQDEMQSAEHPALGAVREALLAEGLDAMTVGSAGPTPVLLTGVERRCAVAIDANEEEGRPEGLYGNAFARASEQAIRCATRRIDPPTHTNLIAMAAPAGGYGRYERETIEEVLVTAYTGFRAAVVESCRLSDEAAPRVVVHTGFWGCGAFGGDRVLMTVLQALAAAMAGLDRLVVHIFDPLGFDALAEARELLRTRLGGGAESTTEAVIDDLDRLGFTWGVSDGN